MSLSLRVARRIAISVIGATMLLVGVLLIFLPGPGVVILAAGLAVLGLEFAWARRWLKKLRQRISSAARSVRIRANSSSVNRP